MKVIGDKKVDWFPGLSIAYERENVLGETVHLEYNYTYRKVKDVQLFLITSEISPDPTGGLSSDLILSLHNIDIDVRIGKGENISYTIGPSLSWVNRSFVIDQPLAIGTNRRFEDRLASLCIGVNGAINVTFPLADKNESLFLFTGLNMHYIHSVWFDARGRNVGNYFQSFLFSQIQVGIGSSF
jgi:hypothetical protein